MNLEEIKELIAVVMESGIAELEVSRGDNKVRIRRDLEVKTKEVLVSSHVAAPQHTAASQAHVSVTPAPPAAADEEDDLQYIKSPIVGTFYEAPAPDVPPFVRVGDHVKPGEVLCIIESMKLMNEIEAEISGTITGKLVENGRPVEYGESIFSIRAD